LSSLVAISSVVYDNRSRQKLEKLIGRIYGHAPFFKGCKGVGGVTTANQISNQILTKCVGVRLMPLWFSH